MDRTSIIIILVLVGILGVSFGYILQPLLNHNNSTINQTNVYVNSTNNSTQPTTNNTTTSVNQNQNGVPYNIPENYVAPLCPNCGSNNVVITGTGNENGATTYYLHCLYCGNYWTSTGMH